MHTILTALIHFAGQDVDSHIHYLHAGSESDSAVIVLIWTDHNRTERKCENEPDMVWNRPLDGVYRKY